MKRRVDEPNIGQSVLLFAMIFLITFSTSITLTSYPQHLAINEKTVIQAIKFISNDTVLIKGNQVQVQPGDIISLSGRDYLKLTGNQIQVGKTSLPEGVRTVAAEWYQNILFTQKLGRYKSNQVVQIIVDETSFIMTPLSQDIISVTATDLSNTKNQNHYNVVFKQGIVYINENGIMLKFTKEGDIILVSTVGLDRHNRIIIRTV